MGMKLFILYLTAKMLDYVQLSVTNCTLTGTTNYFPPIVSKGTVGLMREEGTSHLIDD